MYADAEPKYCEKLIEIKTTELANQDLEKYYKALDRAIMRYHGLKLEEINKIVKEYWIKTYKGNDIDTIEIIAEEEEGSGAAKTRRSYNYRVKIYSINRLRIYKSNFSLHCNYLMKSKISFKKLD